MEYTKEQVKELIEAHNNLALTEDEAKDVTEYAAISKAIEMIEKCVQQLKEVVDEFDKPFQELKEIS